MKSFLLLAGALALSISAAQAQTVVPGGAVPSAQSGIPVGTSNAGSPRAPGHVAKAPNMTRSDKKMMRKMGKIRYKPDATKTSNAE